MLFHKNVSVKLEHSLPWFYVTALLHEGAKRKPQAVKDGEVVCDRRSIRIVFNVPFKGAESAHEEQHNANLETISRGVYLKFARGIYNLRTRVT